MYTHQFCYILLSLSGTMKTWHNKIHIKCLPLLSSLQIFLFKFVPDITFTIVTTYSKVLRLNKTYQKKDWCVWFSKFSKRKYPNTNLNYSCLLTLSLISRCNSSKRFANLQQQQARLLVIDKIMHFHIIEMRNHL